MRMCVENISMDGQIDDVIEKLQKYRTTLIEEGVDINTAIVYSLGDSYLEYQKFMEIIGVI